MNDKSQVLTTMRDEFNRWEDLLAGLSAEQITAPQLSDNWSIKDVIAHLRAWQQRSIARLEAARLNREPEFPKWPAELDPELEDVTRINDWIYATHRDQPWPSVHQEWRDGFLRLMELAQAIPEQDLLQSGGYPWLPGYPLSFILTASCEHHREHAEYLAPLLARLRRSL